MLKNGKIIIMKKYVELDDVLSIINASSFDLYYNYENIALQEAIKLIPAADVVERKTGKWIDGKCDQCGAHAPFWSMASTYYESKFCPHCGAKMIGGNDDV